MQDNSKKNDNSQQEKPRMTKPVSGEFQKNRRKLTSMMKNKRVERKKAEK